MRRRHERKVIVLIRGDLAGKMPTRRIDISYSINPHSDVWLNGQKSAEAIVPGDREGLNSRRF